MSSATRSCPSCVAALPPDAIFCHKCGTATPQEIVAATGEVHAAGMQGVEEDARRAALQQALGDSSEVRRLLGRGGFAEVYVAWDKRLKREIAVKTIRGDLVVNDSLLERFQREAEAVAKLRHPNIVPIYAVGEANGIAYFTMPLIEGESLAEVIDRDGRMPVAEGCRILREAANALHAAHRQGLVHRDIKPENIMLEGPERSAVVMDFGIAKTEGAEGKGLTGTGMLVGTPQYMSPEQAVGDRNIDARSDQYSLAMVGYRMLTGQLPFESDSVQTLIFKTVTSVPPPANEVAPDVPRSVSDVLAKALSKRQEDRYDSMSAFANALAAAEGTGPRATSNTGTFRSALPPLAARVAAARASMPTLGHPAVIVAVLGAIAGLWLEQHLASRTGTALAANRSEAIFAARTFLRERGVTPESAVDPTLDTRDPVKEFLHATVGADSADLRAGKDALIWRWSIAFAKNNDSAWTVDVGPENRIVGFHHKLVDSAQGASLPHDSARALATKEMAARGWAVAGLTPVLDSTITRKHRVDHLFRWRTNSNPIAWKGKDTAYVEVRAGVSGSAVTDYSYVLRTPDPFMAEQARSSVAAVIVGAGATVLAVLGLMAFAFASMRQRVDELQWKSVGRLLLASAVCLAPLVYWTVAQGGVTTSSAAFTFIFGAIFIGFMFVCGLFIAVVGESLATEMRPAAVQGLDELSRGRSIPPEAISGLTWGYVIAGLELTATAIVHLVANMGWHDPSVTGSVNSVFGFPSPSWFAFVMFGAGIISAFLVLYLVALFARWKVPPNVAMVIPALLGLALSAGRPHPGSLISTPLSILIFTVATWRYGWVAGVIAIWLPDVLDAGVTLVHAGGESSAAGIITLVLAFVPLVVALVARPRVLSGAPSA